jgi:chromosome segregation protein
VYLKSLMLRGFKSFADKTQMVFDPGLNVVVGPNGSGKSNISDSILWVLGEQSAKMLRGQAMEDVIFSGSSARQAVNMAEVTLTFDNSDHTLPVDFDEVAITRRMFRSGENQYLINGAVCRLLDVTDILHDSGMGKDTHSIISQGKLDSVLSSRPEDRRELIEEAADISKHRQRKKRSERRLKSMDENLRRAKDISREINRQLRPLERQVAKAQEAHEVQARLVELKRRLAVDEVRDLRGAHERASAREREAEAAAALAQARLDDKGAELERYRKLLEEKGLFVGDLDEQRRRLGSLITRMDSDLRLLDQKGKGMDARAAQLARSLEEAGRGRREGAEELERVRAELDAARAAWDEAKRRADELEPRAREAKQRRRELAARVGSLEQEQKQAQREADKEMLAYARLRDQVEGARTQDGLLKGRLDEIEDSLAVSEERARACEARRDEATAALDAARESATKAHGDITRLQGELADARRAESAAREALARQRANLSALESVDERAERTSPLVASLTKRNDVSGLVRHRLSDVIEAPEDLEDLVERLLGDDLSALVVADDGSVASVANVALGMRNTSGRVTILADAPAGEKDAGPAGAPATAAAPAPDDGAPGEPLLPSLRVSAGSESAVSRLLGDVRVVDSVEEALAGHAAAPRHTYVARSGAIVLADGRTYVGTNSDAERGALERKRRIRAMREEAPALERSLADAQAATAAADERLSHARDADAAARGEVARLRGELSSVTSELTRIESQRASQAQERKRIERSRQDFLAQAEEARRGIDAHKAASDAAQERASVAAEQLERLSSERSGASREEGELERGLSEARLALATARERKNSLIGREDDLTRRQAQLERDEERSGTEAALLRGQRLRVAPLREDLLALREAARAWDARLKDKASLVEADSEGIRRTIGEATAARDAASRDLERARGSATDAKVEIGRVEAKVEAALRALEETGADLEEALALPPLEDREAAEAEADQLAARLRSIGPVNEVAMEQYRELKGRADYISEQVADLESARKSLAKIAAAIDRKMKRRFLVVFDQVNQNFSEIFGMLFPGGSAHIEMTDPEHPAETGIEIVAQPQGKRIMKMTLMSGGEKSLTALALLFAVYRTRTVPFYVFDEVEAALDYANLQRLLDAIERLKDQTQLIVISHQRRTMEQADVLYGVSMQADGVSHVVSQRLDQSGKVVEA